MFPCLCTDNGKPDKIITYGIKNHTVILCPMVAVVYNVSVILTSSHSVFLQRLQPGAGNEKNLTDKVARLDLADIDLKIRNLHKTD